MLEIMVKLDCNFELGCMELLNQMVFGLNGNEWFKK